MDYGLDMRFSPEWLARFSPERLDGTGYLTSRDCASVLYLVGLFSSKHVDMEDDLDAWAALTERHPDLTPYRNPEGFGPDGGRGSYVLDFADARRRLGLERSKEAIASMARAARATVGHYGPVLANLDLAPNRQVTYRLRPEVLDAHPANSHCQRSVHLDPAIVGAFSSVQSVPIAARVLAWLHTPCRTALPPNSVVDRAEGAARARSLSLRIPAGDVTSALGLAQMKVWSPSLLKCPVIAADLLTVGVESEWSWVYQGRTPIMLVAKFKVAPRSPVRASKSAAAPRRHQVRVALGVYDETMAAKGHAKRPRGRPRKFRPEADDLSRFSTMSDAEYARLHDERGQPRDFAQVAPEPANDLSGPYANLRTPADFAAAREGVADDLARSMGRPPEDEYDEAEVWADYQPLEGEEGEH